MARIRISGLAAQDPGRRELFTEVVAPGSRTLLELPLETGGGALRVTAHDVMHWEPLPHWAVSGSVQEWRVLSFLPEEGGASDLLQAVTKVCIATDGAQQQVRMRSDCLVMTYTKSLVSVVLSTLRALGSLVVREGLVQRGSGAQEPLKFLCIGLGGGSVPMFLADLLPRCEVDVVELEPAVLEAASQSMGFVGNSRTRTVLGDGAEFALRAALARASSESPGVYDAVLVDAYDAAGRVPVEMRTSGCVLAQALAAGLLRRQGLVAINLLPDMDIGEPLRTYQEAMSHGRGWSFSVSAEGTNNNVVVHAQGAEEELDLQQLGLSLRRSGLEVDAAIGSPFRVGHLASRNLRLYPNPYFMA